MKTWITLIMLTIVPIAFSQPPETLWTRTYGCDGSSQAFSCQQTTDGGFVFAGYHLLPYEDENIFLVRIDQSGDTLWTRTYGGDFHDKCRAVELTSDGGFILAGTWGYTAVPEPDCGFCCLIKTDSLGNAQWTRTYGMASLNEANDVKQTQDGGYILVGYTFDGGQVFNYDWFIIKTDSTGDTLWTRTFGNSWDDVADAVQQTSDGGYIVAGCGGAIGSGLPFFYVVKLTEFGSTQWERFYGGNRACSILQMSDGGYAVTGDGPGGTHFLRIDSAGDTLWTRIYSGSVYSARLVPDGGFVIAGSQSNDYHVLRTDSLGDILWTASYGGFDNDWCSSVQVTNEGGYIIAGSSFSFCSSIAFYVVRLGPDISSVVSGSGINATPQTIILFPPYPNPFNALATISYQLPIAGKVKLTIHNILGESVATLLDGTVGNGTHSVVWDAGGLPTGIYLCRMETAGFIQVRKLLMLK